MTIYNISRTKHSCQIAGTTFPHCTPGAATSHVQLSTHIHDVNCSTLFKHPKIFGKKVEHFKISENISTLFPPVKHVVLKLMGFLGQKKNSSSPPVNKLTCPVCYISPLKGQHLHHLNLWTGRRLQCFWPGVGEKISQCTPAQESSVWYTHCSL